MKTIESGSLRQGVFFPSSLPFLSFFSFQKKDSRRQSFPLFSQFARIARAFKAGFKKKGFLLLLSLLLLCGSSFGAVIVFAEPNIPRVIDDAGLFSESERDQLEKRLQETKEEVPFDLVILTANNTNGKSTRQFADDYYDSNNFGTGNDYSGALFLIDMRNREIYITTTGSAILFLTDDRIDSILDSAYSYVSQRDYSGAAMAFLDRVQRYVRQGIPNDQYQYNEETGEIIRHYYVSPIKALLALLIALLAGGIPCLFIMRKYNMKGQAYVYSYRKNGRLELTQQADVFRNKSLSSRYIPPPEDSGSSRSSSGGSSHSGGRSTTHTSSSGRTHGGGGRKF